MMRCLSVDCLAFVFYRHSQHLDLLLLTHPVRPRPSSALMPGRPPRPRLVHPRDLPRRGLGTQEGRAAFIHSIAHIAFNAIDLGWDAVYRFRGMPADFYAAWVSVARDAARHFPMLRDRLPESGHDYGDFGAPNARRDMAENHAHDHHARTAP